MGRVSIPTLCVVVPLWFICFSIRVIEHSGVPPQTLLKKLSLEFSTLHLGFRMPCLSLSREGQSLAANRTRELTFEHTVLSDRLIRKQRSCPFQTRFNRCGTSGSLRSAVNDADRLPGDTLQPNSKLVSSSQLSLQLPRRSRLSMGKGITSPIRIGEVQVLIF